MKNKREKSAIFNIKGTKFRYTSDRKWLKLSDDEIKKMDDEKKSKNISRAQEYIDELEARLDAIEESRGIKRVSKANKTAKVLSNYLKRKSTNKK